jgi:predicted ribosome quality control (RQC) complex YloA/Tae2 family protein
MKEKVLTAVELKILLKELKQIVNSKVNKIYQPNSKQLIFKLYKKDVGEILVKIESGKALYITKFKESYPEHPTSFCMYLRKLLNNKFITNITQKDFERIVEVHFDKYILILELFSQGNFILTDTKYKIQNLAHARTWASRVLKKGEIYKYPPTSLKP